VWKCRRH